MKKNKQFKLSKHLTIIIPLHANRHDYLNRILDYYSDTDFRILVCDSSKNKFKDAAKHKNAEYYHYKNMPYAKKIHEILKKVKTKYAVFCGVDDFIIPESIVKCLEFLETHKDYATVQGHYISFYNTGKKIVYGPTFLEAARKDSDSDDCCERINNQLNPYIEIIYAVSRIENLRSIYSSEAIKKIKDLNIWELMSTIISVINGKHKVLPIFYGARESMADSGANFVLTLDRFIKTKEGKKEFEEFIYLLSKQLSEKENIKLDDSSRKIRRCVRKYLKIKNKENIRGRMKIIFFLDSVSKRAGNLVRDVYFEIKRLKNIKKTKTIPGYPFYEKKAINKLQKIENKVKKHNIKSKWRTIQV